MAESTDILFEPFPKQLLFIESALSGKYELILFGGAIRGGKTIALLGLYILLSKIYPGSRWAIVRADLPTIKRNTYPSWEKIKPTNFIKNHDKELHTVTFNNGSQIIFFPESYDTDKDYNRWRGLEVNGFGFEEINECQRTTLSKAFERAGSYIIKNAKKQPPPIIAATCNPSFGWVKEEIYDKYANGTLKDEWLYIQSRIYDNLPLLKEQPLYLPQLKNNLSRYEYEVFVEGNWNIQLKTGGEFLKSFELNKHLFRTEYDNTLPIHVSIDSNVYPYIAVTFWQIHTVNGVHTIKQLDEMPCKDPDNTARRTGTKIYNWLLSKGYNQKLFLYGDCSTQNRNNISDDKLSFAQIIINEIKKGGYQVQNRMLSHNPSVSNVADFLNSILDGQIQHINIQIGENCKLSINDYIEVKQDVNGGMLKKRITDPKTKVSYEPIGHFCDNFKDFVIQAFNDDFIKFNNRFKKLEFSGIEKVHITPRYTL